MFFEVDVHILILLISFGFLAAFVDSVVGGRFNFIASFIVCWPQSSRCCCNQ